LHGLIKPLTNLNKIHEKRIEIYFFSIS
jgi:hypothetical protein